MYIVTLLFVCLVLGEQEILRFIFVPSPLGWSDIVLPLAFIFNF